MRAALLVAAALVLVACAGERETATVARLEGDAELAVFRVVVGNPPRREIVVMSPTR